MWEYGLAKMLKERNNKSRIGACIGKVVGINPLKVSILDGQVILQESQLYICNNLLNFELKQGDEVLIIPAENEQVFFIIDKVMKVGG